MLAQMSRPSCTADVADIIKVVRCNVSDPRDVDKAPVHVCASHTDLLRDLMALTHVPRKSLVKRACTRAFKCEDHVSTRFAQAVVDVVGHVMYDLQPYIITERS